LVLWYDVVYLQYLLTKTIYMPKQVVVQEAVLSDLIHSIQILSDILGTKDLTDEDIQRMDYVLKLVQTAASSRIQKQNP